MGPSNAEFEIKRAIKNKSLVVFAGAGTSISVGFPSWKELVCEMLTTLEQERGLRDFEDFRPLLEKNVITPLQVLSILEENRYRKLILDVLTKKLTLNRRLNLELHKKILRLTPRVITTNYDTCFETAQGTSMNVSHNDDLYTLWKLKNAEEYIFKVHGGIEKPGECILFQKQYEDLYATEVFWQAFTNLLMNATILFVGFSLTDPFVNSIILKINEMYRDISNRHFLITADQHFDLHQLKDIVIPIYIDDYKDLGKKLDELMPIVSNLPSRPYKLFVRDRELTEMMKLLKKDSPAVVIKGEAGMGKKSLALETGYACLQKSDVVLTEDPVLFNNVVWVSSTELTENALYTVFDTIGQVFESGKITKITKLWKKEWEVYKLLQENKTLVIIDNVENVREPDELMNWVERIPESCKVIMTSKKDVIRADSKVEKFELKSLSMRESDHLIQNEIGNEAHLLQHLSQDDLRIIIEYTGGNPEALRLTAGQIKERSLDMDKMRTSIREKGRQNVIEDYHTDIWNNQLSDNSRKFLALLAAFPYPKYIGEKALRKVCEVEGVDFDPALTECTSLNLLMIINE